MAGNLEGYEEVATRISRFYKDLPKGSLRTKNWGIKEVGGQTFIWVEALAYRSAEDRLPGTGTAWCQFPARNAMLRGAELMRAETSAWGRALASIGYGGKHIATVDEIGKEEVSTGLTPVATELLTWIAKRKVPADKIKLNLGAMGVAVGNKRLKTVLTSMSDAQVLVLKERLDA
ncbi:hypothetical protein UFOVP1346_34 [uncultured Caudovirales phage]|uniref:Uncharacterized protein n=1 Tax=uncultured Caudovirales phage TaxID=2100421 RepID=A0A6J5RWJ2_9CAUD|nr:hypothetical protein UFOVP921_14 [uncultured Caudovirales phage]CAB4187706.1 hypothetical protein UFOVP1156_50 [uncultured Caudovirales phage]CAB4200312.1 hypothetical protein UFOVP1346_34 [uncultured Caudovirales phage]